MGNLLRRKNFINGITKELLGDIKNIEELIIAMEYACEVLRQEIRKSLSSYGIDLLEEGWGLIEKFKEKNEELNSIKYDLDIESLEMYTNISTEVRGIVKKLDKFLETEHPVLISNSITDHMGIYKTLLEDAAYKITKNQREYSSFRELYLFKIKKVIEEERNEFSSMLYEDLDILRKSFLECLRNNMSIGEESLKYHENYIKQYNHEKQLRRELKSKSLTPKEVITMLEEKGFELKREGRGSHKIFSNGNETIVVSNHTQDIKTGLKFKYIEKIYGGR